MTSTPWALPGTRTGRPPLKLGFTLIHLAELGTFGTIGFSLLIAWLAMGIRLTPLLGIGLLLLVGLLYALFAVARTEILRISGLYGIDAVPITMPAPAIASNISHGAWADGVCREKGPATVSTLVSGAKEMMARCTVHCNTPSMIVPMMQESTKLPSEAHMRPSAKARPRVFTYPPKPGPRRAGQPSGTASMP